MHMIIQVITPASSKEEALDSAKCVFDGITGEGKPFDYYTTFDEEGSAVSGKGRYGNVPAVLKVKTKAGKAMVAEGFAATKEEFLSHMTRVREALKKYSDEEIFEEKTTRSIPKEESTFLFLVRHEMYNVGKYDGSSVWQYDQNGSGIRSRKDLDGALDPNNLKPGEDYNVLPAAVQF
jgi:hypothetical protein